MCEYWIFSCNHTTAHTCRAYDPSGKRPQIPNHLASRIPAVSATSAPQTPNIGYGFGTGFYPGQTGVSENLPPPPIVPGFDPKKPLTAVQVYTKKKAAKHTELLTIPATSAACSGVPDAPRRSSNPCYQCLSQERKERRAGMGQAIREEKQGENIGSEGGNSGVAMVIQERPPPQIERFSLDDNGAHDVGGKMGRRVKIFSGKGVRRASVRP